MANERVYWRYVQVNTSDKISEVCGWPFVAEESCHGWTHCERVVDGRKCELYRDLAYYSTESPQRFVEGEMRLRF
jgi:hypothetical protein